MTSTICGSGQYYTNEIFKIVRVDRLKMHTLTYIFVGEQDREITNILYNLEKDGTISAKDNTTLKTHFGKNYSIIAKNRTAKIKFIYQRIYTDDTLSMVRKKIFCFLSTQQDLLIEQNQELWVKMDNKSLRMLGPTWTNIEEKPSFLQEEIKPDFKKFVANNGHVILTEQIININDKTLFDATDGLKFENNEIFLHLMEDEIEYLKSRGRKANDQLLLDGYFQKYWPHALIEYDPSVIYAELEKMKPALKAEDRLISFVETVPIDERMFGGCRIIQVLIHITNDYEGEFINLLKVFNLFNLDEKTPFMRYKDTEWPAPLYLFYKPLIESKKISEKQMKDWVSVTKKVKDASNTVIKEVQYSIRGLTLKRYIYTYEGEPKYATINIHRNGNIEVRIAFKEKQRASMKDVYDAMKDIGRLISKINEIDYRFRQIPKNVKLMEPDVSFDPSRNLLQFHGRTRLILLDAINTVDIPEEFNYTEMNEFANKYFTPYLSPILSKRNYEKDELLAKYKRVSYYSRMNLEYEFIHKTIQQNPNISQKNVIILLHENYYAGKPFEEAYKVYKDWERKYGYMGSQGVKGARQTGIEIRIKHGKIHLNGSKSTWQLTNASVFMAKFMNIYFNQSEFLKKKQIRDIFSNELAKIGNIENEVNTNIINNSVALNNINYANNNYGNTLNDIYEEDYLVADVSTNENEENEEDENIENNKNNFNRESYLAKNDEVGKDVRMQCKEQDPKHDVCVDFCEDEFYTLRRLQKYDNPVFRFKSDPRYENYARKCQPQERQPLVMKNDPSKNPKIDPESYKNAVKYGSAPDRQNWYICAQVWCPYEEIPIKYSLIEKDIKVRPIRKGNCLTAKCPSCLKEGRITWLRIVDPSLFNPYVGFIDDSNHPNHLCMPCCFKKPMDNPKSKGYAKFMKCLGKDVDVSEDIEGVEYIMGRDKMPLPRGRFGLLPANLAKLFKSPCETGKMPLGVTCHLRYGVKDDIQQSFLQAIAGAVEEEKKINLTILKKHLFETKLTQKLFDSLNQGELAIKFDNGKIPPIDNFRQYMMSDDQKINEEFLWDFLQRPGILEKDGLNIYIFTSKSIICPIGFEVKEFYKQNRKSIILYTDGRYYEPIFVALNERGSINHKHFFLSTDPEIVRINSMITTNCISKNIINWEKIREDSLGKDFFKIKTEISANEVLEKYKEPIAGQIKDKFNKVVGFLTTSGFILPFKPQGQDVDMEIIDKYRFQTFKNTFKFYTEVSSKYGFPYEPVRVFKKPTGEIIAIQLENNVTIPVIPQMITTELLESPGRYYYDVDNYIAEGRETFDERSITTRYLIYIQESYERLRMELSRKLQQLPEKQKIVDLIQSTTISKKEKRNDMKNIIKKILKKITIVLPKLPTPIESYVKPLLRKTCQSFGKDDRKCNSNPHCYYRGGECRLIILEKSPVDGVKLFDFFVERISDEILRNKLLRDEILEDKLDEIVDKSVEIRNDEIVIYGAKDLLSQITTLYLPKKEFILRDVDLYSITEPNYKGIDKEKYLTSSKELTLDSLNLQQLPSYWKSIFGAKVKYYDDRIINDSLYYSILRVLLVVLPEVKTVNGLKNLQIDKIEHITRQDIDREPIFKDIERDIPDGINRMIAIYRHFNGSDYKNINTITQLKEFIMNDEYPANMVDIYLLSQCLGTNIIVLEKRIKKSNQKGFYGFIYSLKKDYILLLEQPRSGKTQYSIVGKGGNYIFKKKDLPKNIKDFFGIREDEAEVIRYDVPHFSRNKRKNNINDVRKKLIKIKIAKKKINKEMEEMNKKKK